MTLSGIHRAVYEALRIRASRRGNAVPVLLEDAGNVVAERDSSFARAHLAVEVGPPVFEAKSRDSATIEGVARLTVTVFEQPTRNRVGQRLDGPTALDEAEAIACGLHHLPLDCGVLVCTGIGGVERVDGQTVSRGVAFEALTTLTGEE